MLPSTVVLAVMIASSQPGPAATSPQRPAPAPRAADCPAPIPDAAVAAVRAAIATSGAEVAVVLRSRCQSLAINPDLPMHAASTMKVPVMIELFRQVDAGTRALGDTIAVSNTFRSMVDGSPFTLNAADDSDQDSYAAVGKRMSLREAVERMITISSNITTNLLIDEVGIDRIRATVSALGAEGMDVRRKVEDGPAFRAGMNNTTTAAGLAALFEAMLGGRAASPAATREMVAILKRQRFRDGIPAGLPPGTEVAHKTGTITRIHHDGGIVYGAEPYVLVVLTRGIETEKDADILIAGITRTLDQAMRVP